MPNVVLIHTVESNAGVVGDVWAELLPATAARVEVGSGCDACRRR